MVVATPLTSLPASDAALVAEVRHRLREREEAMRLLAEGVELRERARPLERILAEKLAEENVDASTLSTAMLDGVVATAAFHRAGALAYGVSSSCGYSCCEHRDTGAAASNTGDANACHCRCEGRRKRGRFLTSTATTTATTAHVGCNRGCADVTRADGGTAGGRHARTACGGHAGLP